MYYSITFTQKVILPKFFILQKRSYGSRLRLYNEKKEFMLLIKDAEKLHGHIGPFLIIGVRMGIIAKEVFNIASKKQSGLRANAQIPIFPPFSCILDGIQSTTTCTVGNGRLTIENSAEEMSVNFEMQNSNKKLNVSVCPKMKKELKKKAAESLLSENFAWKFASMPDEHLFVIKIQ